MKNNLTESVAQFRFSMPIPIRWNDMDALGHINNVYYFEYFQIARALYMPEVSQTWDWKKHMFVIAHIECDYFRELTLHSITPTIKARVSSVSNKSFEIEYLITSKAADDTDIVHAQGKSINVMVDNIVKKSIAIPDWLRQDLMEYEPSLK